MRRCLRLLGHIWGNKTLFVEEMMRLKRQNCIFSKYKSNAKNTFTSRNKKSFWPEKTLLAFWFRLINVYADPGHYLKSWVLLWFFSSTCVLFQHRCLHWQDRAHFSVTNSSFERKMRWGRGGEGQTDCRLEESTEDVFLDLLLLLGGRWRAKIHKRQTEIKVLSKVLGGLSLLSRSGLK